MMLRGLGFILSVLIAGCAGDDTNSLKAQNNAGNKTGIQSENKQAKPMIKIQQGTVGKVGEFSVGVSNLNNSSAKLSIWNKSLPQVSRNDYLITTNAKTGEIIPVGNGLYRIGKITENAANPTEETVEIESEATKADGIAFASGALALPAAGVLELNETSVELVSIKTEGGKTVAEVETYSNNYPKETLAQKGEVKRNELTKGGEITIGSKKYKIIEIYPAKDSMRGFLEISTTPVQ